MTTNIFFSVFRFLELIVRRRSKLMVESINESIFVHLKVFNVTLITPFPLLNSAVELTTKEIYHLDEIRKRGKKKKNFR